jgi:hypothetical protein
VRYKAYRLLFVILVCCLPGVVHAQSWDLDIYTIGERRRLAEHKVMKLKGTYDQSELHELEKLYDQAMAKNGAWCDLVALAIIEQRKRLDSPAYREIVRNAADSFVVFDSRANLLLYGPPSDKNSEFSVATLNPALVAMIVGELVKGGISFWKAKKELDDARRREAVNFFTSTAQWASWASLQKCACGPATSLVSPTPGVPRSPLIPTAERGWPSVPRITSTRGAGAGGDQVVFQTPRPRPAEERSVSTP